jgi:hypothetical protein
VGKVQTFEAEANYHMNTQMLRGLAVPGWRFVLAMVAASTLLADTTITFQNGVSGYSGAKDVSINTQYSQYNGGNGVLWRGDPELGCYTTTGSGSYTVRYLLKFGGLSVPAGSTVVSATLTISLDSWNSGSGNITGFYLKNSWNPASNKIGWLHRDDTNDWAAAGASAPGVDTIAGKSFRVPPLRPVGAQTVNIPLDLPQIQSWIDSPAANQGIMLVNNNPGEIVNPVSTVGRQSMRPKLTVMIAGATGVQVTVSPTSTTLQPGGTQTFSATVTGSANTAVSWSATGGTITNGGVYTAGSTAGNFTVTATSAADSTKSASAQVTVQSAPAVQVSVSPTNVTLQPGATQPFTATVTGSANTAVTWSATGGTITNAGLYTAGSVAGSFTVTATSVADSTKSRSAQITIQAPAVQVTVSPTNVTLQPGATQQFGATVTGSSNNAVTWTATGGTITSAGLYTAGQTPGNFVVTAKSVADTSKSATAAVQIGSAPNLPPIPRQVDGPYIRIQSPVTGMHFTAPATIRIYADPSDISADDQDAFTVNFFLNGQSIGAFTGDAGHNGYWALTASNVPAGTYAITTQFVASNRQSFTSPPVAVYVDSPPVSNGPVFNLGADIVLSGSQNATYAGTPDNHCVINGNGFQIRSTGTFTGSLNIANCDIRGLGTATKPAIDVTVTASGSVSLTGNVFDTFGTVSIGSSGQAQVAVRNNEFRENTLVPVTSLPTEYGGQTLPVFHATGTSSAQKFFQGNNVGLSTVVFENTNNWLIGGNTDAESNVLMGVRCGFTITGSSNMVLRGNYSQHNYPHRMSQADNFELDGDGFLAEHNVIRSSSWPVRGMGGELRYNLIDADGNADQVVQGIRSGTKIHHNVFSFTVSQTTYGPGTGISLIYNVDNVQFYNNVMDGGGTFMLFTGVPISVSGGSFLSSLRNNVFYNFASRIGTPALGGAQGESTTPPLQRLRYSDYNDFFNPDADNQTNYGLGVVGLSPGSAGYGLHDLGGFNGHMNPKFTQPTVLPFPFAPEEIWTRTKKVSDVLATYRAMYTPAASSPLIGAGDPQDGAGGNIGAVGNGEPADQFGRFGNGTVTPPAVAVSIAPPSVTVQTGGTQQFTATVTGASNNAVTWTATGGTVSSTGLYTAGTTAGAFTVTATSVQDNTKSATATITVGAVQSGVSISVAPTSATVASGTTKQFSATVTGTSNTAVTWTATGGTVSSTGLYTAGSTAGSFIVKATSVQDTTKSATAAITIPAPQPVSVTLSPTSTTLFTSGTQQFTATVTNASNTAVTWTATGGMVSSTGLYTAGTSPGSFAVTATSVQDTSKTASASITITNQPVSGSHPRIILDAPTLTSLRSRMQANTAEWRALKATCDSYVGGSVEFINGNDYPNRPSVGEGYQGSGYFEALMPLGICYQTALAPDPTNAAKYGAKGVAILMAMSDPTHQIADEYPCSPTDSLCGVWFRDYGYGIRNFGVAMGIGYDWFHDLMTSAQKTQLQTALNHWIYGFETGRTDDKGVPQGNFEYDHPQGNYFAGYYAAKVMAALAVEGDSPLGSTWWNDWYNNQHLTRVAPYYRANLAGGGWNEGYTQYGILATRNHSLPALAVKTAKGIDLIQAGNPNASYTYPIDNPRWLMAFTWPTRDMIDDRNELYSTGDPNIWPGTGVLDTYRFSAGFLAMMGDPTAPMMHKYARDAKTALDALHTGGTTEWIDFLFWDPAAPEADYSSLALSYLAPGLGGVAARSDWSPNATFMSFISGPYINNPGAGHESFEKGSPAFERNKNPLLINAGAWLAHDPNGDPGWSLKYDDQYGNWSANHSIGNRTLYNTFQVRQLDSQGNLVTSYGQGAFGRADGARTKIGRFEDGGSYVLAVGQFLEDMYYPFHNPATGQPTICPGASSAVTSLSRQIVYLRPSQFIIYDRSGVCDKSLDQYEAFHFPANPVEVAAPAAGTHRFDVNPGLFAGSMTTILPANAAITTSDKLIGSTDTRTYSKVWRTEVRPTDTPTANRRWITVFDLAATPGQVSAASAVNITAGPAVGTILQSATGNSVVISGTAPVGTAITAPLAYVVPAVSTRHVVTDLSPSTAYSILVSVVGATHSVSIVQGGSTMSSANGVIAFQVSSSGDVVP